MTLRLEKTLDTSNMTRIQSVVRRLLGHRAEKLEEMIVLRAMGLKMRLEEERVSETKTVWRLVQEDDR